MGKHKATEKDVRFALEHMGERLIRTIRPDGSGKFDYTPSPSNMTVPEPIVTRLEHVDFFQPADEGLFPGHAQSYKARSAAPANGG